MNDDSVPPELNVLVTAERGRAGPPAAVREKLQSRLEASLLLAPAALVPSPTPPTSPAPLTAKSWLYLALGLGAGIPTGAALHAALQTPPVPPPPVTIVVEAPPRDERPSLDAGPLSINAPAPQTASPKRREPAQTKPLPADDSLEAERQLLEAARVALTRGNTAAAQQHLEQHQRLFPTAALGEERDVLWIQVDILHQAPDAAAARAKAFRARYPQSLLRPVVDALVPEENSTP